jgi:hypothetical protein
MPMLALSGEQLKQPREQCMLVSRDQPSAYTGVQLSENTLEDGAMERSQVL